MLGYATSMSDMTCELHAVRYTDIFNLLNDKTMLGLGMLLVRVDSFATLVTIACSYNLKDRVTPFFFLVSEMMEKICHIQIFAEYLYYRIIQQDQCPLYFLHDTHHTSLLSKLLGCFHYSKISSLKDVLEVTGHCPVQR